MIDISPFNAFGSKKNHQYSVLTIQIVLDSVQKLHPINHILESKVQVE